MQCLSLCPYGPSRSWTLSKRKKHIFIFSPSDSHTIVVFPCQTLWQYSYGDSLNGGRRMQGWGRQKSANIWLSNWWLSDMRTTTTATVHRAVYRTDSDASSNLVYHSLQHGRPRRIEEKRIYFYAASKSEAEVTNNRRLLHSTYCILLKLTTDRHEVSSGLSAIAELLVFTCVYCGSLLGAPVRAGFPALVSCLAY